jgi:digeranylgeranylglycerophospholipid reductase
MKIKNKVGVIGAGPAGCSAAITLKKLLPSLDVSLIEQRPSVGKIECGEAISSRAVEENQEIIGNFFPKCVVGEIKQFYIKIGEYEKLLYTSGYMIDRPSFNKNLIREAKRVGCEVKTNCKATPLKRNDTWKVYIEDRFTHETYVDECDVIILAGGGYSKLAVNAGLITQEQYDNWIKENVFAYQCKIKSPYKEESLLIDFTPNPGPDIVYHYLFPRRISKQEINVGVLNKHKFVAPHYYNTLINEFLKKLNIENYKIIGRPSGNYIPGGPIQKTFGNGVIAVGDNAGLANPLFYAGIHTALSSGRIGGKVVAEAYEKNDFGETSLSEYDKLCRNMPWGNPILVQAKAIHEKLRTGRPITREEKMLHAKALDITKDYGW